MKIRYILILVVFLMPAISVFGEEGVQTNLEFMGTLIQRTIEEDTSLQTLVPEKKITLVHPDVEKILVQYVSSHITKGLIQSGYTVFLKSDALQTGWILSWHPEKIRIVYQEPKRSSFFSEILYRREAELALKIQFIRTDTREVRLSETLTASQFDTVAVHDLPYIEQKGLILGHPDRPKPGGMRRWLEPAAMIGLTGVIAYLFYSIRS